MVLHTMRIVLILAKLAFSSERCCGDWELLMKEASVSASHNAGSDPGHHSNSASEANSNKPGITMASASVWLDLNLIGNNLEVC